LAADLPELPSGNGRRPRRFVAVAQQLLEAIHTGALSAGDRLPPDRQLAQDFEISRPTVREALLALELVGVVEIRHGSGVYVVDADARNGAWHRDRWANLSTSALFEARTAVEPKIALLSALRARPADVRGLSAAVTRARAAIRRDANYASFIEIQVQFHHLLATASRSPLLAEINAHLLSIEEHPLWALLNQHALRTREQRSKQVDEHATILTHVKNRDEEAAAEAMRRHITEMGCAVIGSEWIA
jgi:GntR family uxuAB operon transcriptional repressor